MARASTFREHNEAARRLKKAPAREVRELITLHRELEGIVLKQREHNLTPTELAHITAEMARIKQVLGTYGFKPVGHTIGSA